MTADVSEIEKWKGRYRNAQEAFQAKHVAVTRLEIRCDGLEAEQKELTRRLKEMDKHFARLLPKDKPAKPKKKPSAVAAE